MDKISRKISYVLTKVKPSLILLKNLCKNWLTLKKPLGGVWPWS